MQLAGLGLIDPSLHPYECFDELIAPFKFLGRGRPSGDVLCKTKRTAPQIHLELLLSR